MKPSIQFHSITALSLGDITHFPAELGRPEFWARHLVVSSGTEKFTVPLFSYTSDAALTFSVSAPCVKEPYKAAHEAAKIADAMAEQMPVGQSPFTCPDCQQAMIRKRERPGEVFCPNPACSKGWMKDSEAIPF